MCPQAFCEDHLPPEALIMGENPRFLALGANHPKQGCYVLHSTGCVAVAARLGFNYTFVEFANSLKCLDLLKKHVSSDQEGPHFVHLCA